MRRVLAVLIGVAAVVAGGAPAAVGQHMQFRPGAGSLGDPYTPGLGNGGYDVTHYGIVLSYDPASGVLTGTTTITATVTANLSRFNLDFALPATAVSVNGRPADFSSVTWPGFASTDRELVVTPASGLPRRTGMTVVVSYSVDPGTVLIHRYYTNWNPTITGYSVWNEPDAASEWWYPANAYPSDKATYDVTVATPADYTAITNGRLLSRTVSGTSATAHWRTSQPMASYLAVLTLGRYDVIQGTVLNGVPAYYAIERGLGAIGQRARRDILQTPSVLRFLQAQWGRYPFDSAGGTVIGSRYASALETQTKPTYQSGLWQNNADSLWAVLHENSHQWFGDDVTTRNWSNCWLAEGFATYNEWLWSQAHGQGTTQQLFLSTYHLYPASDAIWATPLDQPAFSPLDIEVYDRGAMLLQALRNRVGSGTFVAILRTWLNVHRYNNADSGDFVTLAESMTSQDLTSFFQAWLDGTSKPAPTAANGFGPTARQQLAAGAVPVPSSAPAIARTDAALARSGR